MTTVLPVNAAHAQAVTFAPGPSITVGREGEPGFNAFALAEDGTLYAARVSSGDVYALRWDRPDGGAERLFSSGLGGVFSLALSADGETLYAYGGEGGSPSGAVQTYDVQRGTLTSSTEDMRVSLPSRAIPHSSGRVFAVGWRAPSLNLVHETEDGGSFAALLREGLWEVYGAQREFANGHLAEVAGGDVIAAPRAPYVVGRYSPEGVHRWEAADTTVAGPYEAFARSIGPAGTPEPYAQLTGLYPLGPSAFLAVVHDWKAGHTLLDVRSLGSGELLDRSTTAPDRFLVALQVRGACAGIAVWSRPRPVQTLELSEWTLRRGGGAGTPIECDAAPQP